MNHDGDEHITRREFFSLVGWGGVLATAGGSAFSCYKFYFPNVLYESQKVFLCPCHGSIYDLEGNVLGGPAPKLLWRTAVTIDPVDGQMVVDFNHRQDPEPVSTENGLRVDEALREVEPFFLKV